MFFLLCMCFVFWIFLAFNHFPRISKRQDIHQTFSVQLFIFAFAPSRFTLFAFSSYSTSFNMCSSVCVILMNFKIQLNRVVYASACKQFGSNAAPIKQSSSKQLRRFSYWFGLVIYRTMFYLINSTNLFFNALQNLVYDSKFAVKCCSSIQENLQLPL